MRLGSSSRAGQLLFGLLLVGSCGCQSIAEREARAEFARLAHAVDRVRTADNHQKQAPLGRLRAERCQRLCDLKELCVSAYETHVEGILALEEARRLSETEAQRAAGVLLRAQEKVTESLRLTSDCAALEGDYERKFQRN